MGTGLNGYNLIMKYAYGERDVNQIPNPYPNPNTKKKEMAVYNPDQRKFYTSL